MATRALKTVEDELNAIDADKPKKAKPNGVVNIHGREYQTVAYRVQQFRATNPELCLTTEIVDRDAECVVVKASISHPGGPVLATGHAEEYRKASQINRTSALENAETSAIGRALAALGFGGTEFATANEVQNAIHQQANPPADFEDRTAGSGKDAPFPQGPAKNKTHLKDMGRAFWRDVEACGDPDELDCLLANKTNVQLVNQIMKALPSWWDGGTDGKGETFEGLEAVIDRKRRDFEQLEQA